MTRPNHGRCFYFLLLFVCFCPNGYAATDPIDSDVGRDVGEGEVRYNTPYDPKTVQAVTFVAPTVEHPYYEVAVPLGDINEGQQTAVHEVRVNGVASDSFYIFVDGRVRPHDQTVTRDGVSAHNVVVVTRSVWHDSEPTVIEVDMAALGGKKLTRTQRATAPAVGGVPAGWRRYQSLLVQEKAGVDRVNEPMEFSITERAEYVGDLAKEMRVFQVHPEKKTLEPVLFQTFNAQQYAGSPPGTTQPWQEYPGGSPNYLTHPAKTIEAVVLANVPARQSRVYVIVYDNPSASPLEPKATDLNITGKNLGAKIENKFYTAQLFESSGCLSWIQGKADGERTCPVLTNGLTKALHWNPDAFGDSGAWGHAFSWDPPDHVVVSARGPILFRITLSGRMASVPQVYISVSYSFYAGVPYMRMATVTQVRDPYMASAVRNGELVLDSHLVDHFVWEENTGELRQIRTLHGPNYQDNWEQRVDHDVHWIAMTNETDGYGLGVAVIDSTAFNPEQGEATTHRPAYYFYYHHGWRTPLTYFVRAWVYPFSDYQNAPELPVAPGSTYVERMGVMPFYLRDGQDRYKNIAGVSTQLRHPLSQRWGR